MGERRTCSIMMKSIRSPMTGSSGDEGPSEAVRSWITVMYNCSDPYSIEWGDNGVQRPNEYLDSYHLYVNVLTIVSWQKLTNVKPVYIAL